MNDLSRDDPRNTPRVDGSIAWALVLVGLAAVMLRRWQDGALALYVHPSYEPLIAVTACSLLVVAGAQVWEAARQAAETGSRIRARAVWPVVVVGGAVVVTALVPARPLGSAVARRRLPRGRSSSGPRRLVAGSATNGSSGGRSRLSDSCIGRVWGASRGSSW
jgi:hypothetical protein